MPYVAEADVSVPRVIATGRDPEGNEYHETESVVYPQGHVLADDDVDPQTQQRLEDGDDHLASLLRHVSEDEAAKIRAESGQGEAVVPEHEAEAEVLYQDGKDVLTRDEVTELNQNGDALPAEDEDDDPTEGREAEGEDHRVHEVDERRRGDAPAPEAKPAASEKKSGGRRKAAAKKDDSAEEDKGQESKGE